MSTLRKKTTGRKAPRETPAEPKGARGAAATASSASHGADTVIVGVGASAGGIEACGQLLDNIPADRGLTFIIVQHLDPDHESVLAEILARHSRLPVRTIAASPEEIQPNRVYVLPPNRSVVIAENRLKLAQRKRANDGGPPMPIDTFFTSLAAHEGACAVGVILSGTGSDGTHGMKQIKAESGITFAQDDRSASSHGMPASAIAAGVVDFILPPAAIAKELARIAVHPQFRKLKRAKTGEDLPGTDGELTRVFTLLRALNGVDFSFYKPSTLKRRILRRMVVMRIPSLSEYVTHLEQNPAEVDALFQDLLINVTEFFRDPQTFAALRRRVFPRIVKRGGSQTPIRIWVPGCSSGEEVYSLAMSLFEFLGKGGPRKPVQIFGTDVSDAALAKARAGIYPHSIDVQVGAERLRRFFHKADGGYQIAKFVRDSCVFARQNVIEDPPFSKLDLVSCRNLLIYLGPVLQKKVIPIFHYALKPGGHLMLGGSETTGIFGDLFELVDKKNKIYVRRDAPHRHEIQAFTPRPEAHEPVRLAASDETSSLDLQRQVDRILIAQYAPCGVLVNSQMEVLQFRGHTSDYIEHLAGDASLSLNKIVKPDLLVDVRTAAARAIKLDTMIRKEGISLREGSRQRAVNIEVIPFRAKPSSERFCLVLFEDAPLRPPPAKRDSKAARGRGAQLEGELTRLREDLASTKESLQAIIEEQEATNEELKSANEEIQSSNEELQSTNEELETAKEELQSTNEELTTLNEELQTRNSELHQLNNDLNNLLASVSIPILMIGNDLTIRRFTPAAARFFNLIPSDIGRRITDINPNIMIENLDGMVTEVIDSLRLEEHEVQDREGHWYSLRIRPYRTTDNKIDGAVIMLVDTGDLKRALEELAAVSPLPLLTLRGDLRVTRANPAFYGQFATSVSETEGKSVYELCGGAWNIPALHKMLEALPENNEVDRHRVEIDFPGIGRHVLSLSARRIEQIGKGTQVILIAIEDVTGREK